MWPKEDCCICPIPFSWIWTPFAAMCLLKLWFFMNLLLKGPTTSAIGFSIPQTQNMCHSSNFNAFFPVKINKMWNICLKMWFFRNHFRQRLEIYGIGCGMPQTLNMHHSSHFNALFPVKNQQNVKFLSEIVIFSGTAYCTDSKPVALDLAYVKPYICATQAISMHFSQSKSTKCEIFVWNCNILGTTYHRDSKPVALDLACLKP